jgi:hypothetical protein
MQNAKDKSQNAKPTSYAKASEGEGKRETLNAERKIRFQKENNA